MHRSISLPIVRSLLLVAALCFVVHAEGFDGPLRRHPTNPRYFTDDGSRAILLTGAHTWNSQADMLRKDNPSAFDFEGYVDWMAGYPHNFMRLWAWELLNWDTRGNREKNAQVLRVEPHPWQRIGPGKAIDGRPRFDLTRFNEDYFQRLRRRVEVAGDHGIYTSVMLFEGWGVQFSPDAWKNHPFHPRNNINGIDGDLNGDGQGLEIHEGRDPEILEIQRTYVRKVIDTVGDLDNVLYEISNENHPPSTQWQYDMIRFIRRVERERPKQHPVGMTFQFKGGSNATLMKSPADWISPNSEGGYRDNPPPADGTKVVISDTDHLWGIGGNPTWAWKSFLRGLNPISMDPYDGAVLSKGFGAEQCEPIRQALGRILQWSRRVDLAAMTPRKDTASSGYCLANPGVEYLVFVPKGTREVTVDLPADKYAVLWYDTASGKERKGDAVRHQGGRHAARSPFDSDSLLHIRVAR